MKKVTFDPNQLPKENVLDITKPKRHVKKVTFDPDQLPIEDVNEINDEGDTKLSSAIYENDIRKVKSLLMYQNIEINKKDYYGNTPLIIAIDKINVEIVKLLLKHRNIDVNITDDFGWTALHNIANKCEKCSDNDKEKVKEIIKLLIEHKNVDVNIKDKTGNKPLDLIQDAEISNFMKQCIEGNKKSSNRNIRGFNYS